MPLCTRCTCRIMFVIGLGTSFVKKMYSSIYMRNLASLARSATVSLPGNRGGGTLECTQLHPFGSAGLYSPRKSPTWPVHQVSHQENLDPCLSELEAPSKQTLVPPREDSRYIGRS